MWNSIGAPGKYKAFNSVLKIVLACSHGQATVEGGFSGSKNLLVENLKTEGLISQPLIVDSMCSHNQEPCNFPISKSLADCVKGAQQWYHQVWQEKVKSKLNSDKDLKSKLIAGEFNSILLFFHPFSSNCIIHFF